jgi:hypothetical protein
MANFEDLKGLIKGGDHLVLVDRNQNVFSYDFGPDIIKLLETVTNVRDNLAKVPLSIIPSTGAPGTAFKMSEASAYATRAYVELDGVLKT